MLLSLNDLNLPPNPFIILAAITVVQQNPTPHDDKYSPQTPEPSNPKPIPTSLMNLSTIDGWETPHTTTNDNTFYSKHKPRRVHWTSLLDELFHSEGKLKRTYLLSGTSPPSPPGKMKRKLEMGMSSPKRGGVSKHVCEASGQIIQDDLTPNR